MFILNKKEEFMMHWSDKYPHKIWTNILVIDNKVIDYKIGGERRDKYTWSILFNKELISRFDDIEVISSYEETNNDAEHNMAFENGREKVIDHMKKFDCYYDFMRERVYIK